MLFHNKKATEEIVNTHRSNQYIKNETKATMTALEIAAEERQ